METYGEDSYFNPEKESNIQDSPEAWRYDLRTGEFLPYSLSEKQQRQILEEPWLCPDSDCSNNKQTVFDTETQKSMFGFDVSDRENEPKIVDRFFTYPYRWDEREGDSWDVGLRCPCCELFIACVLSQKTVEVYDDMLNEQAECFLERIKSFARLRFGQDADRIAEAIKHGGIEPMDFRSSDID